MALTDNERGVLSLEHLQCCHAALDMAKEAADKIAAENARVATLIPQVVDALVKHERIDPANRDKAARMLTDRVLVLETLLHAADPSVTVRPHRVGEPDQEKQAGVNGTNGANHWARHRGASPELERKYREDLLGPQG